MKPKINMSDAATMWQRLKSVSVTSALMRSLYPALVKRLAGWKNIRGIHVARDLVAVLGKLESKIKTEKDITDLTFMYYLGDRIISALIGRGRGDNLKEARDFFKIRFRDFVMRLRESYQF